MKLYFFLTFVVFGIFGMKNTAKTLMEKIYENYSRNVLDMYVLDDKNTELCGKYEGNELQWHSILVLETLGKPLQDKTFALDHEKLFRKNLEQVLSENNREEASERKIQKVRECIFKQKSFSKLKETAEEIFIWNKNEGLIANERFQKEVYTRALKELDVDLYHTIDNFIVFSTFRDLNEEEAEKWLLNMFSKLISAKVNELFGIIAARYIVNKIIPELRSEPKHRRKSFGLLHEKYFETIMNNTIMGLDLQKYFREISEKVRSTGMLAERYHDQRETLPHCVVFENAEPVRQQIQTEEIIKEGKKLDKLPILENPCSFCCDGECSPVALPKKKYGNLCGHLNGKILAFCSENCGMMKWINTNKTCPCCRQEIRIKPKRSKGKGKNFKD